MPTKKDEASMDSRHVKVERNEFDERIITPRHNADTAPTEDNLGRTILSEAVRDEQEEQGYVADIQPKSALPAMTPITGVTGTAPGGIGAMQATGNIIVAAAASVTDEQAVQNVSPVPDALQVEGLSKLKKEDQLVGDNPATAVTAAEASKRHRDNK